MARPLPKDLEATIKGAASQAEARSNLIIGLILGSAFGFGFGASFFSADGNVVTFGLGAAAVVVVWYLASRARRKSLASNENI